MAVFLKIDGVDGESRDAAHKDWIDLVAYSWGLSQPASSVSGTGRSSSERVVFQDFTVVKAVDKSSPKLFLKCSDGTHIGKVTLELALPGKDTASQETYMKYQLENVIVSSIRPAGGGDAVPTETISFNFSKIHVEYTPSDPTGEKGTTVSGSWDVQIHKSY